MNGGGDVGPPPAAPPMLPPVPPTPAPPFQPLPGGSCPTPPGLAPESSPHPATCPASNPLTTAIQPSLLPTVASPKNLGETWRGGGSSPSCGQLAKRQLGSQPQWAPTASSSSRRGTWRRR